MFLIGSIQSSMNQIDITSELNRFDAHVANNARGVSILDDALLNPQKYTPKKESIQRIEQKVREMWDNLL